jgi:hypothetical protein
MLPADNDPDELSQAWSNRLKKLTSDQVRQIDEALVAVGDYGEVHLIVQRGELRYVNKVESYKAIRRGGGAGPGY